MKIRASLPSKNQKGEEFYKFKKANKNTWFTVSSLRITDLSIQLDDVFAEVSLNILE
jgi:hypothetical protein